MRLKPGLVFLALAAGCLAACSAAGTSVIVEWTTANEVSTAGFNLYRSESADGPFLRVNPSLIPASSDPLSGGQYRYEDQTVLPGRTYYYQLEDVEYSGGANRHGPIAVTAPGLVTPLALGLAAAAVLLVVVLLSFASRRRSVRVPASLDSTQT